MEKRERKNALIIVMQEIKIEWTKKSRGAPEAIERNKIPKISEVPLMLTDTPTYTLFEHKIHCHEYENFQPRESVDYGDFLSLVNLECLKLELQEKSLRVIWGWDADYVGAPSRDSMPKTVFELGENEWGQISYNGRFPLESTWRYQETIVNLGLFTNPTKECFLGRKPNYITNKKAHLF